MKLDIEVTIISNISKLMSIGANYLINTDI